MLTEWKIICPFRQILLVALPSLIHSAAQNTRVCGRTHTHTRVVLYEFLEFLFKRELPSNHLTKLMLKNTICGFSHGE